MEGEQQQHPSVTERVRVWATLSAHSPYATPSLFVLTFVEAIFFPVPVDVFLIPLVVIRARSWVYYTFIASFTSVLGGAVGYAIGFFLFDLVGASIVGFYGLESELVLVEGWLMANVVVATFVSAFTPIPYKVFTIAAGLFGAPFALFILASLAGRSLRYALVCYLAHRFGSRIARLFLKKFKLATILFVVLAVLLYVFVHVFFF